MFISPRWITTGEKKNYHAGKKYEQKFFFPHKLEVPSALRKYLFFSRNLNSWHFSIPFLFCVNCKMTLKERRNQSFSIYCTRGFLHAPDTKLSVGIHAKNIPSVRQYVFLTIGYIVLDMLVCRKRIISEAIDLFVSHKS